jgi:hypothetical protein
MNQMKRTLARLVLVLPLLWGVTQAAARNTAQPTGRIALESTSIAAGVGVNWGDGTLRFQGHDYKFSVSGLSLVDVGISKINAVGKVYNLAKASDLAGTYVAGEAGFALAGGADVMALRNQNGIVITLSAVQEGAKLALGPAGMSITLKTHGKAAG